MSNKVLHTTEGFLVGRDGEQVSIIEVTQDPGAEGKSQTVGVGSIAIGSSGSPVAGNIYIKVLAGPGTDRWNPIIDEPTLSTSLQGDRLFDPKNSCLVATTVNIGASYSGAKVGKTITVSAPFWDGANLTIDGQVVPEGSRVMVWKETLPVHNGIYVNSGSGVLTRASDADDDPTVEITAGANTYVETGSTYANARFILPGLGDIDVDVEDQNWEIFLQLGDISTLRGELNNTQDSMGPSVAADGTFAGHTGTNHLDSSTSLTDADVLLDQEIGPDLTANVRLANSLNPASSINAKIETMDDAIGNDSELTPEVRSSGQVLLANSVYSNIDAIDLYMGSDSQLTPVSRTVGVIINSQTFLELIDSLDLAIGLDVTPSARTTSPMVASESLNFNIDAVDAAIGEDTVSNVYVSPSNTVNQNLDAVDSQTKSNTNRVDELSFQISTTTSGGSFQQVDALNPVPSAHYTWDILVRESASPSKVASITVGATIDRTSSGDFTDVDSYDLGLLEINSNKIAGFDYRVELISNSVTAESFIMNTDSLNGNTTFVDDTGKQTITTVPNARHSTAVSKFGNTSAVFDGNGNRLDVSASPEFNYGTGDFTIELWVWKHTSTQSGARLWSNNGADGNQADNPTLQMSGNSIQFNAGVSITGPAINNEVFTHIAAVRSSGVVTLYVNGVSQGSVAYTGDVSTSAGGSPAPYIGDPLLIGYIDSVSVTKGTAVYTSNFTAPVAPFSTSITTAPEGIALELDSDNALDVRVKRSVQSF